MKRRVWWHSRWAQFPNLGHLGKAKLYMEQLLRKDVEEKGHIPVGSIRVETEQLLDYTRYIFKVPTIYVGRRLCRSTRLKHQYKNMLKGKEVWLSV